MTKTTADIKTVFVVDHATGKINIQTNNPEWIKRLRKANATELPVDEKLEMVVFEADEKLIMLKTLSKE